MMKLVLSWVLSASISSNRAWALSRYRFNGNQAGGRGDLFALYIKFHTV